MEYKNLRIEQSGSSNLYKIRPLSRGAIPKELSGLYTSVYKAKEAIDRVDSQRGRKKKDAKTVSASGD